MLILRRKAGESLVIGEEITVTVLDINEGSVRLAIDAPKIIPILRSELLQAADANRDAAGQSPALLRLLERGAANKRAIRPVRRSRSDRGNPDRDGNSASSDASEQRTRNGSPAQGTEPGFSVPSDNGTSVPPEQQTESGDSGS